MMKKSNIRKQINIRQSGTRLNYSRLLFDFCYNMNLSMIWVLKLGQTMEKGLVLYRNIYTEMTRQKGQKAITVYFLKLH